MAAQVAWPQASAPHAKLLRRTTRSSRRRWICSTGSCRAGRGPRPPCGAGGGGAPTAADPRVEPHRAGDHEALRRPRRVQGVPADALDGPAARPCLVKIAQCGKRALAHYYQQQRASASKSKGLGEVALVEHITGVVMKLMAKASGDAALPPPASACTTSSSSGRGGGDGARARGGAREARAREGGAERARRGGAGTSVEPPAPSAGGGWRWRRGRASGGDARRVPAPREADHGASQEEGQERRRRLGAEEKRRAVSAVDVRAPRAHALANRGGAVCTSARVHHGGAEQLDAQMKKLIAVSSGAPPPRRGAPRGGARRPRRAPRERPDAGGAPAASGVVAESSVTSESVDHGDGSGGRDESATRFPLE